MAKAHKAARGKSRATGKPGKSHVAGTFPTREQVLDFVRNSPDKVGKREIARAFGIKGGDRLALKKLLGELVEDGSLAGNRKEMREKGHPLLHAATEGGRLRFRPVMMTSFAFILGLLPLVIAEGPAMLARRNVSTPVFGGMLAAAFIGIFVIPALYVVFQSLRERLRPSTRPVEKPPEAAA